MGDTWGMNDIVIEDDKTGRVIAVEKETKATVLWTNGEMTTEVVDDYVMPPQLWSKKKR